MLKIKPHMHMQVSSKQFIATMQVKHVKHYYLW